ncbi:MAG: alcohol dehydrogenase catalytic domain-containing protein [Acidobacteria bacterium]|nr:alcohol dehydrogenase catalytic domain-containing protein [Acidobacteriota bacterium]
MRALCLDFERKTVREARIADAPAPGPGEVRLRLYELGVCATDRELSQFHFGEPPPGESLLALGHEALAQVVETGPGVEQLQSGDWVVPMIRRACVPACDHCRQGRLDLCQTDGYTERGIFRSHGYFAPFATDPAGALIRVPDGLLDIAVLAEPLSVAEKAVETGFRCHPLRPRTACILGAGPLGLLSAMILSARGLEVEVVSLEDEDDRRVKLLRTMGVRYRRGTASGRFDLVLEAAGAPRAAEAALNWLAPCGVLVLIGAPDAAIALPGVRTIVDNLSVAGIVNAARCHFELALADLSSLPRPWLEALIERRPAHAWRESLTTPSASPKLVHRLDEL